MQMQSPHQYLEVPTGMCAKLEEFRRRVWIVKLAEGMLAAVFGLLLSYLLVFALDRVFDTPAWVRTLILVGGATGLGVWFPLKWHRWVWQTRQLEQVARLLRHRFPRLGDQLLGIVELAQSEVEQHRSETLCRAAMRQVDEETNQHDFSNAVPNPRHRQWGFAAGIPLVLALAAIVIVPAAGTNALARWLMPWKQTERYTFAQLEQLPDKMVVPYAERFEVKVKLTEETAWSPAKGKAKYGGQDPVRAELNEGRYAFELPPQKDPDTLTVSVGDAKKSVEIEPTTRPELTSMIARVKLPDYLQYKSDQSRDVRGGSVSMVKGSRATFEATATRDLDEAIVDGEDQRIAGKTLFTSTMNVTESRQRKFEWRDQLGLSAKEPFVLSINARDDDAPAIACNKLAREQVLLETKTLTFEVFSEDDFGVQKIGMEWVGIEDLLRNAEPAKGEKIIAAGSPEERQMAVTATFSPKTDGIKPQVLKVRLFAVDYLPERKRVYSPTYYIYVLSPEEHAIWVSQQLRKWFRQSQAVYEREQRLHETNKELRNLPPAEIETDGNRRRIESQAAAERTNAARLSALTVAGERLINEAAQNDQFNVATMESWAAMLNALKDIADNRMLSVADLLKQASEAPGSGQPTPGQGQPQPGQQGKPSQGQASKPNERQAKIHGSPAVAPGESEPAEEGQEPSEQPPSVGNNRDPRSSAPGKSKPAEPSKIPSIADVESGDNDLDGDQKGQDDQEQPGGGKPKFGLPTTVINGGGPKRDPADPQACPVGDKMDEAVEEQEDLLAEFAKVADELQKILDNLEGSTFVKRLKAASRRQIDVASDLNKSLNGVFGVTDDKIGERNQEKAERIAEREIADSEFVYNIQEDIEAYYNRVHQGKFRGVMNEMKETQVVNKLRGIGDAVKENLNGQSIARTEFWADTLDRWAEQLVGPG